MPTRSEIHEAVKQRFEKEAIILIEIINIKRQLPIPCK